MNIYVLQLSDIHIASKSDSILSCGDVLAMAACQTIEPNAPIILALSGDIAQSGKPEEYSAALPFFRTLVARLKSERSPSSLHFVSTPGNHDCDFRFDTDDRRHLLSHPPATISPAFAEVLCAPQKAFRTFVADLGTDIPTPELITESLLNSRYTISFGTTKLEIVCINTAVASTIPERQALFVDIPDHEETDCHARILIHHHPAAWLTEHCRAPLQQYASTYADLILTGHEHRRDAMQLLRAQSAPITSAAPALRATGVPYAFQVHVIDTLTSEYRSTEYTLPSGAKYFVKGAEDRFPFFRTLGAVRSAFTLSDSYLSELRQLNTPLTHPRKRELAIEDIFVYPDLQEQAIPLSTPGITTISSRNVPAFVRRSPVTVITGSDRCGNSSKWKLGRCQRT